MAPEKEYKKVTTNTIQKMKAAGEKISMITAYDFSFATLFDAAGIDIILVGDSASNVMAGHTTTLPITLDQMIYHAQSVVRARERALIVIDIPFGYYQSNSDIALASSIRIMKESGGHTVKLEGGEEVIDSVRKTSNKKGIDALKWGIEPINLYEKKLRNLGLGPTYVRVSGTWANAIYFQNNDETKLASPPKGFKNILTRQQWKGVVDFCKAVDGKLVSSFPISDGMRDENGVWQPTQVKSILDYTQSIGGEIVAAEFFNEPKYRNSAFANNNT